MTDYTQITDNNKLSVCFYISLYLHMYTYSALYRYMYIVIVLIFFSVV